MRIVALTQVWRHFLKLAESSCSVFREKRLILCSQLSGSKRTRVLLKPSDVHFSAAAPSCVCDHIYTANLKLTQEDHQRAVGDVTFSPSFLRAVRISIFCCVYTSLGSFPTMTSRSICKNETQILAKQAEIPVLRRNRVTKHALHAHLHTSASLVLSCPGCFLAKSRITSGVLNAWLMAA